ncbi:hypothetical protein B0H19DRAFT_128146 [Mycena capillaripes]|nr:hypothetical protein B0H19DRAFT_128146 [Mycena capillaripes]
MSSYILFLLFETKNAKPKNTKLFAYWSRCLRLSPPVPCRPSPLSTPVIWHGYWVHCINTTIFGRPLPSRPASRTCGFWNIGTQTIIERQVYHASTGREHPRTLPDLWLVDPQLKNTFQLTVLHPKHLHPHPEQSINILGADGQAKAYKASPEGVLKDENGIPLPPFALPSHNLFTHLNPILVNCAAALRFRRLQRMDPALSAKFSPKTREFIEASLKLHAAVIWTFPPLSTPEASIEVRSVDLGDIEMRAGPSGTADLENTPATFLSGTPGGSRESEDIVSLIETLGAEKAADIILGGYAFQPLPELVDGGLGGYSFQPLVDEEEDGGASPPPPTDPSDDGERWDLIPAELSTTKISNGRCRVGWNAICDAR